MLLTITDDGHVFDSTGTELFELTVEQQDYLVKLLYPELPTTREFSKKQTSFSGVKIGNMDWLAEMAAPYVDEDNCEMANRMDLWGRICGGRDGSLRLRTLYCNRFHMASAANDLNLPYDTLSKWFRRWKEKALAMGLTADKLFSGATPKDFEQPRIIRVGKPKKVK